MPGGVLGDSSPESLDTQPSEVNGGPFRHLVYWSSRAFCVPFLEIQGITAKAISWGSSPEGTKTRRRSLKKCKNLASPGTSKQDSREPASEPAQPGEG